MTLYEIVGILKQIALTQPNVKSATDGSIYDIMNATNSVKYDVVHFSQTKHISNEETDTYGFNIFYVSRLEDSLEDNRLQIQSIGKEVLDNILRTFCENWNIDYPEIIFYPFTQKFADLCAGCYCRVDIEVPKDLICADDYTAEVVPGSGIKLQDVTLTVKQNGLRVITPDAEYDGIGEVRIVTDVPQTAANLEYKEVEYTENGDYTITPDEGYDGLSEVAVSINVASGGGYDEGYEDGVADQKAKLSTISVTENGTYTRSDGYSAITVNVPQGQSYDEGYEDGEAAQKAKLVSTAVTENGTYTREDGYSAITVNVDDRYDEGYADGFAAGASACSGSFVSALTLNVDSAITDYGTATTTYSPATAITDIYYTSSDPTIATIDSGTGIITVLSNGTVTICAKDGITHLQDSKQVNVTKTPEPEPEYKDRYLTTIALEDGTMFLSQTEPFRNPTYYRINKGSWVQMPTAATAVNIQVQSGDVVEYKSNPAIDSYVHISSNCAFDTYGNIMSLIYGDNFRDKVTISSTTYDFSGLYINDTGLTSAEHLILPATSLTQNCYNQMFAGCTSLTTAPALPATKLANNCYYNMFSGCTSLTTAPELPDVDFGASGPAIPQFAYVKMFYDCSSLNYIKCLVSSKTSGTDGNKLFEDWVNGVSGSGTFVRTANTQWNTGNNGIPSGWTIIDNS